MSDNPIPYWMAFAHAKNFSNRRKMEFLIETVHDKDDFTPVLLRIKSGEKPDFKFSDREWKGLREAMDEVPNYAFLAEKLADQGVEIIHVMEKFAYPRVLKENLQKEAPVIIYLKGNADLLNMNSIAIVGSRNCSDKALEFTDMIAKQAVTKQSVIVSGFAKGVDKQALDSALKYKGKSIIVLPQGIDTFNNKSYYAAVVKGDVLIMSTYHPKAPWSVGLAMDRNKIIYGMAMEIYAAESGSSGGTWTGVLNGIKRGRKVYVRKAGTEENNANNLLISKGAIPMDDRGNMIKTEIIVESIAKENKEPGYKLQDKIISDAGIAEKVIQELRLRKGKGITIKEILSILGLQNTRPAKIIKLLANQPELSRQKKGRQYYYHLKSDIEQQTRMF